MQHLRGKLSALAPRIQNLSDLFEFFPCNLTMVSISTMQKYAGLLVQDDKLNKYGLGLLK